MQPGRERGKAELQDLRDPPQSVSEGWVEREGRQPDGDADAVPASVETDQRPGIGDGPPGSPVKREHQRPKDDVCHGEPRAVGASGDVADQDRHRRDGQHRHEVREPEEEIVGVEPVGVRHEFLMATTNTRSKKSSSQLAWRRSSSSAVVLSVGGWIHIPPRVGTADRGHSTGRSDLRGVQTSLSE
jgi:hypothetical protein